MPKTLKNMKLFAALRKIREFERLQLPFLKTVIDFDIVIEIGFAEEEEQPLTLKQLFLLNISSRTTVRGMLLEMMGHEVCIVHDGVEAVEKASTFGPDIILLDLGMPQLNGYEACSRIRAQPSNKGTLIVALTGWTQEDKIKRSQQAGFDF